MARSFFTYVIVLIASGFFVIGAFEAWQQDWTSVFVVLQAIIISLIPYVLRRWLHVYVPFVLQVGLVLFMCSTLVLGEVADFYSIFWWWDLILHGSSSAGLALIGFVVLLIFFEKSDLQTTAFLTAFLAFSISMSVAVLWEIYEFLIDLYFKTDQPMQPSNTDTMTDLLVAVAGALLVCVYGYRHLRWQGGGMLGRIIRQTVERNS